MRSIYGTDTGKVEHFLTGQSTSLKKNSPLDLTGRPAAPRMPLCGTFLFKASIHHMHQHYGATLYHAQEHNTKSAITDVQTSGIKPRGGMACTGKLMRIAIAIPHPQTVVRYPNNRTARLFHYPRVAVRFAASMRNFPPIR